jgi:hypothetical protein
VAKRQSGSVVWIYWLCFLISLVIFGFGLYLVLTQHVWSLLATGCACMIGVLVTWPLALSLAESRECGSRDLSEAMQPINERLEQFSIVLNLLSEQQLLSDRAKSVAFREKDREALRRAIQEEIGRHDFEAAWSLADEMEKGFGYKQEAERLRQQINERHGEIVRRQIGDVTGVIDRHVRAERWVDAHKEAERLLAQFPNNDQVRNIPADIHARREQHKNQLKQSFDEAVARKDTDGAIEILKKLDQYLTPAEAESMQETARSIFKAKLENLRTQFSVAVQDHNWPEAIRLGDVIIRDFPNTQMAKEVRERMSDLRERASEVATATA